MPASLREKVLSKHNSRQLKREAVEFMGETVYAWELTSAQRDKVEAGRIDAAKNRNGNGTLNLVGFRAAVVMAGTRESGEDRAPVLFHEGDDRHYLNDLPAAEMDRLFSKIIELSGMGANAVEDAKKNSSETDGSGTSSGSPSGSGGHPSPGESSISPPAS